MKNVLIVTPQSSVALELEELAHLRGLRGKICVDANQAVEWLRLRPMDLVLADCCCNKSEHKRMAATLWRKSPSAPYLVFDMNGDGDFDPNWVKLFGGKVARYPDVDDKIGKVMDLVGTSSPIEKEDFEILVVEDLHSPRDIICIFLESLGFPKVHGVESATEALHELEATPDRFSCVVTDIRMPEIDGREMITVIRSSEKLQHLPIVVLTAYGTVDTLIDCLKAGASGFLVKPPKKDDILRELSRAMRIKIGRESPRLATYEEAEHVRRAMEFSVIEP